MGCTKLIAPHGLLAPYILHCILAQRVAYHLTRPGSLGATCSDCATANLVPRKRPWERGCATACMSCRRRVSKTSPLEITTLPRLFELGC